MALVLGACLPLCFVIPAAAWEGNGGESARSVLGGAGADGAVTGAVSARPAGAGSPVWGASSSDAAPPAGVVTPSDAMTPSDANAALFSVRSGDLWKDWIGDYGFLSGKTGDGTKEKPYQIATKAQLMGLSELASRSMTVPEGETYAGNYAGVYFRLANDINLGGMSWMPIGFYRDLTELSGGRIHPFTGHFDGNGRTVSNFRMYAPDWDRAGFFGSVENAEICGLTLEPGNLLTARETAGILAGSVKQSIVKNITVMGNLRTSGTAGGVVGEASGSVLENCTADHVAIDAGTDQETYVGGIAGKAADSVLADCTVNTGNEPSSRIQGGGYVGGIVGFQNSSNVYNAHVMGTVGGSGSRAIGGITGNFASGKLKVARFEGTIAPSGLGSAAHEGSFIGTRATGFSVHCGTGNGSDVAYLFADTEKKISAGICGCGVGEDNRFFYDAHIGFWHRGDNRYTLVQGGGTRPEEARYFYEELEDGILHVMDVDDGAKKMTYQLDHFAPNSVGRPARGYLISVLQSDAVAGGENFYDVAKLTARGSSAYSRELDKSHRGAVAAGDVVTVVTAPKNTDKEKFQMENVPTYTNEIGRRISMEYQKGGAYTFRMPDYDTEIQAVYRKVAADVRVQPEELLFRAVQERSGDRKHPKTVTEVRDRAGKLIAKYINGELEQGTTVQDVTVQAVVDANNDVADRRVSWSVDDGELIRLKKNSDEDGEGYTEKSASLELNLAAGFFKDILESEERKQAENGYRYRISDTIYGGGNGGVAVLTAQTRAAESFEGKPLTANCKILVTFQIKDRTQASVEQVKLNRSALNFKITRTLSGSRTEPQETVTVTEPQAVSAAFMPEFFDKKEVHWNVSDGAVLQIAAGDYTMSQPEEDGSDYKNSSVTAVKEAKWIQDIIASDRGSHELDPYAKQPGHGRREESVSVTAEDRMGNRMEAACPVTVEFETVDRTEILPEAVRLDTDLLTCELMYKKSGDVHSDTVGKTGFSERQLTAEILPALAEKPPYTPYDREVLWISSDPEALQVDKAGRILPVEDAKWIRDAMEQAPYTGEKIVTVTAIARGNGKVKSECQVRLKFSVECLELSGESVTFEIVRTKTGRRGNPTVTWTGNEAEKLSAVHYGALGGKIIWDMDTELLNLQDGNLTVNTESEKILELLKKYPHTGQVESVITVQSADGALSDRCKVLISVKEIDKTYSSGSGSNSGGGGGGSSSSGITTSGSTQKVVSKPVGSITGTWVQDGAGNWLFTSGGRTYADEWAFIHNPYAADGQESTTWFRFDEKGHMRTGWYQDPADGNRYYLHASSDGTLGRMYTGWSQLDGAWYYFNPMSDGSLGRMYTGWNWIGGKCYFFDVSGKMASNGVIGGFTVNERGAWTVDGIEQGKTQ